MWENHGKQTLPTWESMTRYLDCFFYPPIASEQSDFEHFLENLLDHARLEASKEMLGEVRQRHEQLRVSVWFQVDARHHLALHQSLL